jgi:toxin ParE1/3/4
MLTGKYKVRFLKIAEEDFTEIIEFIATDNPTAADKVATKIESNLELLSENPLLGRIPRDKEIRSLGYRFLIVQSYIIFCTIEYKTVYVHRILRGSRNCKSIL